MAIVLRTLLDCTADVAIIGRVGSEGRVCGTFLVIGFSEPLFIAFREFLKLLPLATQFSTLVIFGYVI